MSVLFGLLIVTVYFMLDNTIQLPDGRTLGYALYGPLEGQPVLYFHGTPSSRLEPLTLEIYGVAIQSLLAQYNIRLIAVDRPGMGLSSFHKKGTFLSFANDAKELLQQLAIEQCSVLCWSGGGPFALAMAYQYPQIITGIYIIAGFSRRIDAEVRKQMYANKFYFMTSRYFPWIQRLALRITTKKKITKPLPQRLAGLPNADYAYLKNVEKLNRFIAVTIKEGCRQSTKGPVYEAAIYFNNLGFPLSQIRQRVHYWWGTEDKAVVPLHPKAVEKQMSDSILHYKHGEGHLSIYIKYIEEVLQTIVREHAL